MKWEPSAEVAEVTNATSLSLHSLTFADQQRVGDRRCDIGADGGSEICPIGRIDIDVGRVRETGLRVEAIGEWNVSLLSPIDLRGSWRRT